MLFNSYLFLFVFLPISFGVHALLTRRRPRLIAPWLGLCSLVFYGAYSLCFLPLLVGSIAFNYVAGREVARRSGRRRNLVLAAAIAANLLALGVFKYLAAALEGAAGLWPAVHPPSWSIALPLGISFFTFTQIGFLLEQRSAPAPPLGPVRYLVFVSFFPHLIAGPIYHEREMGPQLAKPGDLRPRPALLIPGLALFVLGLAKKVMLADPLARLTSGFDTPQSLDLIGGWAVAVGYTLQLYFDFSGYSDMAIGLAAVFGLRMPLNFNSPLKSQSIIEFWKRWHITLGRFLQLYLYGPLALKISRWRLARGQLMSGAALRTPGAFFELIAIPTVVTMGLAGVWHGAGLHFLVFGLLHAGYLLVNHALRLARPASGEAPAGRRAWNVAVTGLAIVASMVFFRARSCARAASVILAMIGAHGVRSTFSILPSLGSSGHDLVSILRVAFGIAIVWGLPNSQELLGPYCPSLEPVAPARQPWLRWRPDAIWAAALTALFGLAVVNIHASLPFIYFGF